MLNKIELRKAERKQSKIRVSMSGPSGSGKTYSALLLGRGLTDNWNKIALIDTENKRGDLYSDLGDYNIITLEAPFTPERFIEAIKTCETAGMEVIIIDSLSHEWEGQGGCLEANEKLAAAKFKGNTWAAWSETTPRHQRLISAIIASSCHVINTMRSKTDTIQTDDKKIKKVGLKDIQREGFEYEMTVSFNLDRDTHCAVVGKDNTHLFEGIDPFVINIDDGKKILDWNASGAVDHTAIKVAIMKELNIAVPGNVWTTENTASFIKHATGLELTKENSDKILEILKEKNLDVVKKTPEELWPDDNKKVTEEENKAGNVKANPALLQAIIKIAESKGLFNNDDLLVDYFNCYFPKQVTAIEEINNKDALDLYQKVVDCKM